MYGKPAKMYTEDEGSKAKIVIAKMDAEKNDVLDLSILKETSIAEEISIVSLSTSSLLE